MIQSGTTPPLSPSAIIHSIQRLPSITDLRPESQLASLCGNLPNDYSNKYLLDWLITNRFDHLTQVFISYTTNDLLRLSKEDMINLCGAPDGIRCYNMAHNIHIRPKLTLFVTFAESSYYSALFVADLKSKLFVKLCLA